MKVWILNSYHPDLYNDVGFETEDVLYAGVVYASKEAALETLAEGDEEDWYDEMEGMNQAFPYPGFQSLKDEGDEVWVTCADGAICLIRETEVRS